MAEKELRMELDDIVRELIEIKSELKPRHDEMKKIGTPPALFLVGFIGMKVGLKISRTVIVCFRKSRFLIPVFWHPSRVGSGSSSWRRRCLRPDGTVPHLGASRTSRPWEEKRNCERGVPD